MTLIEIIIIIGIIVVLAAVSIPAYRLIIPNIELNNMHKEAIADLREAQYKALETQIEEQIIISGTTVTWRSDGTPDQAYEITIEHEGKTKTITITPTGYIK